MTEQQRMLADLRLDLRDLCSLSANYHYDEPLESLLESLLQTAITIINRNNCAGNVRSGAILLMGEDGSLHVRTAMPPYEQYLHCPLPDHLQVNIIRSAETRCLLATGDTLIIPLCSHDRTRGILFLDGDALPTEFDDSLSMMVQHASLLLSSAILFDLAAIDTTTGMFTRTFMLQRLYEAMKAAYRSGQDLTVLMMDLNNFKRINDTYGHLTGDRVLHEVGMLLRAQLRETDVLGRYGGDEFLVVLTNTPIYGGLGVSQRLQRALSEMQITVQDETLTLSISIGIGGISHESFAGFPARRVNHEFFKQAMEMIIAQTDGLMYRAKHETTSRIASAHPLTWESLLRLQELQRGQS